MPNLNVLAAWAQIIAVPLAIIAILVSVYLIIVVGKERHSPVSFTL